MLLRDKLKASKRMRLDPFKNDALRIMVRAATGVALGILIASTAWAEPEVEESVDWLVDRQAGSTGELAISMATEPTTLVYGDVIDATVDVANGTDEDRQVVIKVLLGEVAHFVRGDGGVRFESPDRAENQRRLEWPARTLPAGARGRVTFQFLVTWDTSSREVYLQADALDPTEGNAPVVTHLRQAVHYPEGGGGFLELYGFKLATVAFAAVLVLGVWRAKSRLARGESIASSLSGLCLEVGAVLAVLFTSILWSELTPWFGWKEANGDILDVRYSLDTHTIKSSQGPSSTVKLYSGSLTLSFEGPEGPVITSGYRQQSSVSSPEILDEYRAGSETVCYYDPSFPERVVVERDLRVSGLVKELAFLAIGLFMAWFGYRANRPQRRAAIQ
ncbi:hypothetical protein MalM25_30750 [Planctomycetes bacterium MalM25]|nr:hypothetical protein MalM25_30750 [Planctomycetes bacterium MalM25]